MDRSSSRRVVLLSAPVWSMHVPSPGRPCKPVDFSLPCFLTGPLALCSCIIAECGEEAVVGMDSTRLTLHSCALRGCKGPGVDLSDSAQAVIVGGAIADCVGGVWAWDSSQAKLHGTAVAGGPSHALLVDGTAHVEARVSGQWSLAAAKGCTCRMHAMCLHVFVRLWLAAPCHCFTRSSHTSLHTPSRAAAPAAAGVQSAGPGACHRDGMAGHPAPIQHVSWGGSPCMGLFSVAA